jgi:hypothetical protein
MMKNLHCSTELAIDAEKAVNDHRNFGICGNDNNRIAPDQVLSGLLRPLVDASRCCVEKPVNQGR